MPLLTALAGGCGGRLDPPTEIALTWGPAEGLILTVSRGELAGSLELVQQAPDRAWATLDGTEIAWACLSWVCEAESSR